MTAQQCVVTREINGGLGIVTRNTCKHTVEARGACLPSPYADEDEPFPGTYSLDSWLFTLKAAQEQTEPNAAACRKRGGKMQYVACQVGIPYFTAADGSKYGCYR